MALIDKASLLFVPSVVAEGKAFNILPSGNRAPDSTDQNSGYDQTRADFDFDRGSNAAATRVNADGLIEKYRENLLLQSNNFGTTWQTINASVTSGQSGYDGGSDAWLLTSTGGPLYQSISESGVVTFSVYAKANIGAGFLFRVDQTTQTKLEFNISTGAFISGSNYIDYNSTTIGGGWYRLSVTFLAASTSTAQFRITDGSGTNISGSAFIQSAQLESGLVATDYLDSTSVTGKAGVLVDLPRINYDANGENGSLLLEPSRANLVQFSEYFSTASGYWINVRSTIETNSTTSPEGLNNASKILQDSTTTNAGVIVKSITASGSNTFSFFAKKGSVNFARLSLNSGTETSAYFDLENGEVGTTNSISESDCFIEDMGNDWYRCGATYSGATNRFNIYLGDRDGITTLLDASNAYIYIYGAQWEASASYPSSYIPNHGESGGVTRAADYMSTTPTDLLGSTTGSWFMELDDMTFEVTGTSVPTIYLGDDTQNCLALEGRNSGNNKVIYLVKEEGGAVTTLHAFTISGKTKFCFVWSGTTLKVFRDGTEEYSSTSFTQPTNWDLFVFNHSGRQAFSKIANIQLYDTALSDSEAQTLTTL